MTPTAQKILLIDDTTANILVLSELLASEGEIFFATSGKEGLELAEKSNPDLILLDIMMPEMDGYEVCARLKANPVTKHIPVIFITALNEIGNETRGLELGAVDYITKPFVPAITRLRVKNHLELKRQRDLLAKLSLQDGLTGVANRRAYEECLTLEWKRAVRSGTPISTLMIDIDNFKNYNDTYGHAAGDECLKSVAKAICGVFERPADHLARYGGEEFVCILPNTDQNGALLLAGKALVSVRNLCIPHAASTTSDTVTVSIGSATGYATATGNPRELELRADHALYKAKQEGRNRVVCG